MKHLALSWAEDPAEDLKDIDFIFHVALNAVETNENIEDIMIEQHKGLKGNDVQPEEIRTILRNQTKRKIVLLLDGYDEYKYGTNSDIDHGIDKGVSSKLYDCPDIKRIRKLRKGSRLYRHRI